MLGLTFAPTKSLKILAGGLLTFLLVGAVTFCLLFVRWDEMVSSSMEPTISGRGNPPIKRGDTVFYTTCFSRRAIAQGDLVLVAYTDTNNNQTVKTVRRVAQVPTNSSLTAEAKDAKRPLQFRVKADAPKGADSDNFGPLPEDCITGKVIYILRSR